MRKYWKYCLLLLIPLAACSSYNDKRGRGDAPVKQYDDTPAYVINMPDQFANVAIKCYGGNGVYETTREAAPVVVADDPMCNK